MKTDIPLKVLMAQHGEDLLPLFGIPYAELVRVETIELPTTHTRLDNVLHIRSPNGQEYLLVVEWQGYADKTILWRLTSYLAWLAQRYPNTTILGAVVYLTRASDMGDTLMQWVDDDLVYHCRLSSVQLWKQDAQAAVATGNPGLCALSPLMQGASKELVLQALDTILNNAEPDRQKNLLSVLTTFSEPWMSAEQLLRLVGKERLMESQIWNTLLAEEVDKAVDKAVTEAVTEAVGKTIDEKETEFAQKIAFIEEQRRAEVEAYKAQLAAYKAQLEAEEQRSEVEAYKAKEEEHRAEMEVYKAQLEAYKAKEAGQAATLHINDLHQALENALVTRFPQATIKLMRDVRQVTRPSQINDLLVALVAVQDMAAFAHKVQEILHADKN